MKFIVPLEQGLYHVISGNYLNTENFFKKIMQKGGHRPKIR